jgi:glycerol uptake facilitator protein
MVDWSPVIGEFVGTFVLIVLGNGVVAGALLNKSKAQNAGWISITAGWGLAVFAGVWAIRTGI